MKRALSAGAAYFLALFALGFILGTIRVLFVVPHIGLLGAVLLELPLMLIAAFFLACWVVGRWQVPVTLSARLVMALWFLVLLALFETLLGTAIFGQTLAEQWTALTAPAGLIGLTAQVIAALLPLVIGRGKRQ